MYRTDKELNKQIDNLKPLNKRQYSTAMQLIYLTEMANILGLYDAADYISKCLYIKRTR